jgi:hypothetical protein
MLIKMHTNCSELPEKSVMIIVYSVRQAHRGVVVSRVDDIVILVDRFRIKISLLDNRFRKGKPMYERVAAHLASLPLDEVTLRAVWTVDGIETSISDEANRMAAAEQPRLVTIAQPSIQAAEITGIAVPDITAIPARSAGVDKLDEIVREADEAYAEVLEWCGATVNGFTRPVASDDTDDTPLYTADWQLPQIAPSSARSSSVQVWQCARQWHVDSLLKVISLKRPTVEWCCVLICTEPSANGGLRAASCIVLRADAATRVVRCGTAIDKR